SVRPSGSVMVICVLLNDAAMCTTPCGTTRFSRFFLNSFLRFATAVPAFAGAPFAGAPVSGAAPSFSFATLPLQSRNQKTKLKTRQNCGELSLLTLDLLFGCDCTAPRTFPRPRVGVRALPANRQIAPMANPAVRLDFNQAAHVHLNLLAEIAFHSPFLFDDL